MARLDELLKYIDSDSRGIEIAPYFNPAAPKAKGYNVQILDVFDTKTLRAKAIDDPFVPNDRISEIEKVDYVGSATNIEEIIAENQFVGVINYIVSSHNFEHLPNPIKFLNGCYTILAPGGVLSMAVPDCRACFDHYRSLTKLSDWLDAYAEDRQHPTPSQVFDGHAMKSYFIRKKDSAPNPGCNINRDSPAAFQPVEELEEAFKAWQSGNNRKRADYIDAHCSVFFNLTLELMLRDLIYLGLIKFRIKEITDSQGHEFFVHLEKGDVDPVDRATFYKKRAELLRAINQQLGCAGFPYWRRRMGASIASASRFKSSKPKKPVAQRLSAEIGRWKRFLGR